MYYPANGKGVKFRKRFCDLKSMGAYIYWVKSSLRHPVLEGLKIAFIKPPWELTLIDGETIEFVSFHAFIREMIARKEKDYKWSESGRSIVLKHSSYGDPKSVFENGEYSDIPVNGSTVVDIGANICDSAIFFSLKGARKVYAFEPHPKLFLYGKENLEINGIGNVILENKGIGRNGFLKISQADQGAAGGDLHDSIDGTEVEIITLSDLVNKNDIREASLKMDCEGCEYESIIAEPESTLRLFKHIKLEFHYGDRGLTSKLENAGFEVRRTKEKYSYNPDARNPHMMVGYIYARRRD